MKHIKKYLGCLLSALMIVSSINIGIATDTIIYTEELETEESNIYFEDLEPSNKTSDLEENGTQNNSLNLTGNEETETVNSNISLEEINAISFETNDIIPYSNDVWTYSYTGTVQEFTAPYTGKYHLDIYGASGGVHKIDSSIGALGGYTYGDINLIAGEKLYICVGEAGTINGSATYNGGGQGGQGSGAGGGASSVTKTNRGELKNFESYLSELVACAGGGGGTGSDDATSIGCGGGLTSTSGACSNTYTSHYGGNATQSNGFSFGLGENYSSELNTIHSGYGGAGGGGLYGGFHSTCGKCGGGGGSGYINKNLLYDYNTEQGINSGNGKITITYKGEVYTDLVIDLNGHGSYDGNTEQITITKKYGESYEIKEPQKTDDYEFYGYEVVYGNVNDDFTEYTYTFENSYIKALWKAPLSISSEEGKDKQNININFYQNDYFDKKYLIYQSLDGSNWYPVFQDKEILESEIIKKSFDYVGHPEEFIAPVDGLYKLEVMGSTSYYFDNLYSKGGGYSYGYKFLKQGDKLYIVCGGANKARRDKSAVTPGGYNGGGSGGAAPNFYGDYANGRGGGGATHIATELRGDGQLKNYNSYRNDVAIVAGGAGGPHGYAGVGGGLSGGYGVMSSGAAQWAGGTQISGYAFGQGQNGASRYSWSAGCPNNTNGGGGGGGGWYGGYAWQGSPSGTNSDSAGGGGSGYIGGVLNGQSISGYWSNLGHAIITLNNEYISGDKATNINVPDKALPNTPSDGKCESYNDELIVSWKNNGDNGTTYFHKAESYISDDENIVNSKLCDSNIIQNYAETGIKGYYYYVDTNSTGIVTTSNLFTSSNSATIERPTTKSYMHIAAIDNAGNISDTYNFEIPSVANYTVKHYKMDLNGNYVLDETITNSETIGVNVTPEIKTYEGFTSPQSITKTVLADNSTVIEYYYERNKYPVIYIDKNSSGTELGRTTKQVYYEATVRGADIGSNTADNAYYNQYKYVSDISATVTTSGATVYRIFEFCKTEATSNLQWNDNNDSDGFRPDKYKLKLKQNGVVIDEVELPSDITNHTFSNLPKYDVNGDLYQYTFDVDATERYEINFDDAGNLIVEDYQPAHFSVTIPKKITLNGNTGRASYTVSVNGTFYYNDTLTVKPNGSFTLIDRSNISSMTGTVIQNKTGFTKEDLPSSINGNISVNKTYFSGKWQGKFNFEIKFVMQN